MENKTLKQFFKLFDWKAIQDKKIAKQVTAEVKSIQVILERLLASIKGKNNDDVKSAIESLQGELKQKELSVNVAAPIVNVPDPKVIQETKEAKKTNTNLGSMIKLLTYIAKRADTTFVENASPGQAIPARLVTKDGKSFYDAMAQAMIASSVGGDRLPKDFLLEVSKGNIPGSSIVNVFGHNANVGDPEESLWEEGGVYVFPSAASVMTVSSSSANDTEVGTGARTVLVVGLDSDYNEISEIVTLNGQSGVTTTKSYLRLRTLKIETVGASGSNEGIIYIGTGTIAIGKPENVFCVIGIGEGISHFGPFTVPAGKTAYAWSSAISVESGKFVELHGYIKEFNKPVIQATELSIFQATITETTNGAFKHPEKTDIDFRALVSVTTGDVKRRSTFILVDN